MSYVSGFHHITLCADTAQEDIDFFTKVVGQRMIKQTVLFDGRYAHYHLYYSNANAEPGSVMTTFPYHRVPGRKGSGQISASAYTIPKGTAKFWVDHLNRHNIMHTGIQERFGQKFVRFEHPCGLQFDAIEEATDSRVGWTTDEIKTDTAMRGFMGTVLSVREVAETERFFIDALGFKKTGTEGNLHRYEIGTGGPNRTVTLVHEPDKPAGSWTFGAGTRTVTTSTRSIAAAPAGFSWSAPQPQSADLRVTNPPTALASNSFCPRGLRRSVPRSSPCSIR